MRSPICTLYGFIGQHHVRLIAIWWKHLEISTMLHQCPSCSLLSYNCNAWVNYVDILAMLVQFRILEWVGIAGKLTASIYYSIHFLKRWVAPKLCTSCNFYQVSCCRQVLLASVIVAGFIVGIKLDIQPNPIQLTTIVWRRPLCVEAPQTNQAIRPG